MDSSASASLQLLDLPMAVEQALRARIEVSVLTGGHVHVPTSDARDEALARLRQGHAAKLHVPLRSTPSTSAVLSLPGRFWTWTAVDEHGTVAPVMNSFAGSEHGLAALAVDAGPEQWMRAARHIRHDLDFAEQEPLLSTWSDDPFALGAYASHAPGTTIEDQTALEAAVGAVSFAGEYAEAEFTGLMEGALRSGIRAAQAVLAAARGESHRTGARTDEVHQAGTR
ncbi:FAD-dependent oxidoreductase [Streptomyces hygroscopicus]|uniref:FAD-dependent oxidoreductase n=1 Tax=Streptomyces hygroscopicus TaxID=1912 RepID=UPI0036895D8A